jgi:hypothetical protein
VDANSRGAKTGGNTINRKDISHRRVASNNRDDKNNRDARNIGRTNLRRDVNSSRGDGNSRDFSHSRDARDDKTHQYLEQQKQQERYIHSRAQDNS